MQEKLEKEVGLLFQLLKLRKIDGKKLWNKFVKRSDEFVTWNSSLNFFWTWWYLRIAWNVQWVKYKHVNFHYNEMHQWRCISDVVMTITFEATFKRAFQISDNPFQNLNQNKIKYRITIVDTMKSTLYDLKFQS